MDAVVNPVASPATIVLDNKDDYRREGYTAKDAAALAGMHVLNDIHVAGTNAIRETSEASRAGIRETSSGVRDTIREISENSRFVGDQVARNVVETKNADLHNADRTGVLSREIDRSDSHMADRICSVEKDVYRVEFNLSRVIEQNAHRAELLIEKTSAATQLQQCMGFKDALIDSSKNAAAAALAAATNTAAIQAAIAACCCEQKELIRAEAGQTRDLINSLNTQDLQRQLSDAKNALATVVQSDGIVSAILAKLKV